MARRSDFAQKLLDDLRLRKQRVAASAPASSSQKSTQSNQLPIDAYAYSKQIYRGSKNAKTNEITSFRSNRNHKSTTTGEVSSQIVPYGHGREMSDLSMALAFAFENGVKLKRTTDSSFSGSIMGFFNQIRRGSMDFGRMERQSSMDRQLVPTSYSTTLSPVQINEIARGAQKLNQILNLCSNGLNVDRNSIEFAKELLKGAMDLEDSLRMLVELQKTSEIMVTSQRKNRITLLEEDEDDDDDVVKIMNSSEQKQLARPVFSFDKPSRHSQNPGEVGNINLMQRPITLAYSKDGRSKKNKKNDIHTSKLSSHKRSASCSSASAQSNPDRGRIPNVIAKLMGLDNLPEQMESQYTPQKDTGSTQKIEGKTGSGRTKTFDQKNKQTENLVPPKKQKVSEVFSMPATTGKELMLGADKNSIIQKADRIKGLYGLEKVTTKIDKKHNSVAQINLTKESQKDVQVKEKRQDHTNSREQKSSGKGKTMDPILNHMLEQARERSQVESSMQEEKQSNGSILQSENRYENKQSTTNQKKSQNHLGTKESHMLLKYLSQEERAHAEHQVQQSAKPKMQVRPQRSETTSNQLLTNSLNKQLFLNQGRSFKHNPAENLVAMKSEEFLNSHNNQLSRYEASTNLHVKMKEKKNRKSGQISSLKDRKSEAVKGRSGLVTVMDEKSVDKLAKKLKNNRMQKIDKPGKIDKVLTGRNGTMFNITMEVKHQRPMLQEGRQSRHDMLSVSKEEEHNISCSESVAIIEPFNVRHQTHDEAELPPTLSCPDGRELSLQEPVALVRNDPYQDVKPVEINDLHDQVTIAAQHKELKSCEIAADTTNGIHEDKMDVYHHSQLDQNISCEGIEEPLTESENRLKWILVMSQLFLNTTEALFRLNIPHNILQGGGLDNHNEGSKLILDCGYEVMKRKGIQRELKVHHCSKISISTTKIGSLDDLVRQLNKDMAKLKFYGRNRSSQTNVEDYLPKMLEYDIYNKDPDINCMWDFGWNDETLAFIEKYELIRDMEKHILNGLLDEVTGELLHVQEGLHMIISQ